MNIEKFIRENIEATPHMSLATTSGDQPWVCEVHFAYDDDLGGIYFVSLQSTRHCQEIAANPNVAGNIIRQHELTESPNGIYFEGEAAQIEPTQDQIEKYCTRLNRDVSDLAHKLQEEGGRRMYKISIKHWAVFGNLDGTGNKKYELEERLAA